MIEHLCLRAILLVCILLVYNPYNSLASPANGLNWTKYVKVVNKLTNYKKLVRYNWWHFEHCKDIEQFGVSDYWQKPYELFINKVGDCEDFAIWAWYILSHHGYKTQILILKNNENKIHSLTRCKKNGKIRYVGMYEHYKNLPEEWRIIRILNQPFKKQIKKIIKQEEVK